jgi:HEAT repeat protein
LVRESTTIHVLRVESVEARRITFKTLATLKGKAANPPFQLIVPLQKPGGDVGFRTNEMVLCFSEGQVVATLHARGIWSRASSRVHWNISEEWYSRGEPPHAVVYEGETAALRQHVVAILEGRETTITARATVGSGAQDGRLCRIKAGLKVRDFVLSDESPNFVGWGSGEAEEVTKLADTLRTADVRNRILAASDLAHLGAAARPALPALRRALRDPIHTVSLASARALVRLDAHSVEAIESIQALMAHSDPSVRSAAVKTLADLGRRGSAALPSLLKVLRDSDSSVRATAACAVGSVAADLPQEGVAALVALLKQEDNELVWRQAIRSLASLGSHTWSAIPTLKARLAASRNRDYGPACDAVVLLARFDPPPVELLVELLLDFHTHTSARQVAARQITILGSRARIALPALRQAIQDTRPEMVWLRLDVAEALLAVDPVDGPALVAPALLGLAKDRPYDFSFSGLHMLGRCGRSGKQMLPALVQWVETSNYNPADAIHPLVPLLTPADRELLPALRRLLSPDKGRGPLVLAEVLRQMGYQEESLKEAVRGLTGKNSSRHDQNAAARWLGKLGKEAQAIEPELRKAIGGVSGAERTRLALTLWQVRAAERPGPRRNALTALSELLWLCEGEHPALGIFDQYAFWYDDAVYAGWQENAAVAAAVTTLHNRLESSEDTVASLTRALRDSSPHVRLVAALLLARVEPRHADLVPALQRLLERYPHFYHYSADTLHSLGSSAAPLVPQILPLLRHHKEEVWRSAAQVLHRIAPAVARKSWGAVGTIGGVPDKVGPLWDELASDDPVRADLAVWRLAGAGPPAVALIRERLRPSPSPSTERINRLIVDLDSAHFKTRQRAAAELAEAIEASAPALRRASASKLPLEQQRRIETLLVGLDEVRAPELRRHLRAIRLLAELDSSESRALLKTLSGGDKRFLLTREAKFALKRLETP